MTEPVVQKEQQQYGMVTQVSVILAAFLLYTVHMTSPALSAISEAFPGYSSTTIKLITTIPSLMLCIFSLVSGLLTARISIKKCVYIAMVLQFVGILPAFFGGFQFVIFTRIVFGAGFGLMFPMASALVTDLFQGAKRDQMMGFKSAFGALAGVIFQTLGGVLAAINWRLSFLGFLLEIPIAVMIILFVPDTGVKAKEAKAEDGDSGHITKGLVVLLIAAFLLNTFQYSFILDVSFVVSEEGLGTSVDSATALNMYTAFACLAGLVYAPMHKLCKRFMPLVATGLVGIAMLILAVAPNMMAIMVGGMVFGLGFGFTNPCFTLMAASCVTKPAKSPLAISMYTSTMGLGQFLSAYITGFCADIFGLAGSRADWQVAAVAIIGGTIVAFVVMLVFKARSATAQDAAAARRELGHQNR